MFTIQPVGDFSLRAASRFGRGFTPSPTAGSDEHMLVAFPVEDAGWESVAVRLSPSGEEVRGDVATSGGSPPEASLVDAAREQVRRMLSLDVDGRKFADVGARDEVVARLRARYPGLRPVLFHSPYEAAAWTIIGQRIRIAQAARIKAHLAETLGERVTVDGVPLVAFPSPQRLLDLPAAVPGLTARKLDQLRSLARAAHDGELHPARLRARPAPEALEALQRLPGIGPFAAELILVRGAGDPDHFTENERRLHAAMRGAYDLPEDAPVSELRAVADTWRPYRSWVALLLRRWVEDRTRGGSGGA